MITRLERNQRLSAVIWMDLRLTSITVTSVYHHVFNTVWRYNKRLRPWLK